MERSQLSRHEAIGIVDWVGAAVTTFKSRD